MSKLFYLLLLSPFFGMAQKNGITFQQSSWNQLLEKAKNEKKIIFVDAYTTWCGPCKQMAAEVFSTEEAGTFYNRNFVNAKIDMEKGEGLSLAKKYEVTAYPTLLFINGDGKLLHKAIGYLTIPEFIATGEAALNPGKQFYTLKEAFLNGGVTNEQLYSLALISARLDDPSADKIAAAFLKKNTNWLTQSCITVLLNAVKTPADEYFTYLNKNEKKANEIAGNGKVTDVLNELVYQLIADGIPVDEPTRSAVKMVETGLKKYRSADAARRFALSYGTYLSEQREEDLLMKEYTVMYLNEFGDDFDWLVLNDTAWKFFETETDKTLLRYALGWALKSVSKESNSFNNDTVAQLYFKLGYKKEARSYAETSIRLGKEAGEDVTETENLLKKLK